MLIKKSAFCPGLRCFPFSFLLLLLLWEWRKRDRTQRPHRHLLPRGSQGEFIFPTPPKPPRGLGVQGVEAIQPES